MRTMYLRKHVKNYNELIYDFARATATSNDKSLNPFREYFLSKLNNKNIEDIDWGIFVGSVNKKIKSERTISNSGIDLVHLDFGKENEIKNIFVMEDDLESCVYCIDFKHIKFPNSMKLKINIDRNGRGLNSFVTFFDLGAKISDAYFFDDEINYLKKSGYENPSEHKVIDSRVYFNSGLLRPDYGL